MSGRKAKQRRRQAAAAGDGAHPGLGNPSTPSPLSDEDKALLRKEVDKVRGELGDGLGSLLLGMMVSHPMSLLPGADLPDFRESAEALLPMLLAKESEDRARRAVAWLLAVADDPRSPGMPANMPAWADTAEIMLDVIAKDTRISGLLPAERIAEYEQADGRIMQLVTVPRAEGMLTVSLDGRQFTGDADQAGAFLAFADECLAGTVPHWEEDGQPKCAVLVIAGDGVLSIRPTVRGGFGLHVRPPVTGPEEIGPVPDDEWFPLSSEHSTDAVKHVRAAQWWHAGPPREKPSR